MSLFSKPDKAKRSRFNVGDTVEVHTLGTVEAVRAIVSVQYAVRVDGLLVDGLPESAVHKLPTPENTCKHEWIADSAPTRKCRKCGSVQL